MGHPPSTVMIRLTPAASAMLWKTSEGHEQLFSLFRTGHAPAPPERPAEVEPGEAFVVDGATEQQGPVDHPDLSVQAIEAFVHQALARGARPSFGADVLAIELDHEDPLAPIVRGTLDVPVSSQAECDALLKWALAYRRAGIVSNAWIPAERAEQPGYNKEQGYLFPVPPEWLQGESPNKYAAAGLNLEGLDVGHDVDFRIRRQRRGFGAIVWVIERDWTEGLDGCRRRASLTWGRPSGSDEHKKHGTSSLSILAMDPDNDEYGGGIAPDAYYLLLAAGDGPSPAAPAAASLYEALAYCHRYCFPGDIVLVEEQVYATAIGGGRDDIPACVDVDPLLRELLVKLGDRGAIPILPSGNGGTDLATLSIPAPYRASPINPARPAGIRVGAVSATTGHMSPDSNYGALVQLCSWGSNAGAIVVGNGRTWGSYGGTSAASAIIAGAAAVTQAMYRARYPGRVLGVHGMLALLKVGSVATNGSNDPNAPRTPNLGAIRAAIDNGWTWPPPPVV